LEEDGIRDFHVTGVQTCALPISPGRCNTSPSRPPPGSAAPPPLSRPGAGTTRVWLATSAPRGPTDRARAPPAPAKSLSVPRERAPAHGPTPASPRAPFQLQADHQRAQVRILVPDPVQGHQLHVFHVVQLTEGTKQARHRRNVGGIPLEHHLLSRRQREPLEPHV